MDKELVRNTLIMIVGTIVILMFTVIFANKLKDAVKVDGEILCTYVVTGKDSESYSKSVALMSVTYFYNGKRYISDVGITTQLGKPTGKKITVYVDKDDPTILYNPSVLNWFLFFDVVVGFCAIISTGRMIKMLVKNHSDKEMRRLVDSYNKEFK